MVMNEKTKNDLRKFLTGCLVIAAIGGLLILVFFIGYYLILPDQFSTFEWSSALPSFFMLLLNWWPFILVGGILWMTKGPRKTFKTLGIALLIMIGITLIYLGTCAFSF